MSIHRDDDCTFVSERLELFLDGELAGSENLRFVTHLKECEECAETWSDDEAVSEAIMVAVGRDIGVEAPVEVEEPRRPITHSSSEVLVLRTSSTWWRLAGTAVAASLITGLVAVWLLSGARDAVEESPANGVHVVSADDGAMHRRPGDSRAVRLGSSAVLENGAEIRTPDDARVVLGVGEDRGSIVLAEGTTARLTTGDDSVALAVDRGRVSVDVGDVECRVTLLAMEVGGREATFDVWTPRGGAVDPGLATLVVSRGRVRVTSSNEVRRIAAGETWYLMEGGELIGEDAIMSGVIATQDTRHVERLKQALEAERMRRHELEKILSRVRGGENAPSADEAVSAYLALQREAGLLEASARNAEMARVTQRLGDFGTSLLAVIERRFHEASGLGAELDRRSLVRLACGLRIEGRSDLLHLASRDPSLDVRATTIACLSGSRAPWSVEMLRSVATSEAELELRLDAAVGLAGRGDAGGVELLVAEYRDAEDAASRVAVVDRLARIEPVRPVREFFFDVVRSWSASEGERVLRMAMAWLQKHDVVAAIPLLRDIASRGPSADLLLLMQETVEGLERH